MCMRVCEPRPSTPVLAPTQSPRRKRRDWAARSEVVGQQAGRALALLDMAPGELGRTARTPQIHSGAKVQLSQVMGNATVCVRWTQALPATRTSSHYTKGKGVEPEDSTPNHNLVAQFI